ncbi:MAG: tetratricopeptide repeat protein [Sneathiellaceae bacterium]
MAITDFAAAIAAGLAHLDQGRPEMAAFLFGEVLEAQPTLPDAINGMASAMMRLGRTPDAMTLLQHGLDAHPDHPDMRANRGALCLLMKDYDGALRCFDTLLQAEPGNAGFLANRGSALMAMGRMEEAMAAFGAAVAAAPDHAGAWLNMGLLHIAMDPLGNAAAAEADLQQALAADPMLHGAWSNLFALRTLNGDLEGARMAAERALILAPHLLENHQNFAQSLYALGHLADARRVLEKLRRVDDGLVQAELLLAQISVDEDRPAAASAHLHRAAELRPDDADLWCNLAALQHLQGQVEQAGAALDRALALEPGNAAARLLKGRIDLAGGRLAQGMANLSAMYDLPQVARHAPFLKLAGSEPSWDGTPLGPDLPHGGHLVLAPEADDSLTYLMLRFARAARGRVARVTFLDFRGMAPLLDRVPGIDAVVAASRDPDLPCDAIQRLGALPGLLPQVLEAPAAGIPYMSPPPRAARQWQERVAALDGPPNGSANLPTVGLLWRPYGDDRPGDERALPLKQAERLLQVPGLRFVSLQFGPAEAEVEGLAQACSILPLGRHINGPADLAAALAAVDLAILVDGPAADLAGAMGLPAWILLPHVPEWRWAQKAGSCIWYPTVTAYRQARAGDWESAVAAAARGLERLTGG